MDTFAWDRLSKIVLMLLHQEWYSFLPLRKDIFGPGDQYIVVFRHGESEDNAQMVLSGWRNPHITDLGKKQAEILAEKIKDVPLDVVIVSDLIRSVETAHIALSHHTQIRYEVEPRIKERNYGDLQGVNKIKLFYDDQEDAAKWRRGYDTPPPNGESMRLVERRVIPFLDELVERVKKDKINVALSVHGNSMRAIRRYFEHMSIEEMTTHENPLGTDYALYVVR